MSEQSITIRPPTEAVSFEQVKSQTLQLAQFYKSLMTEGTDFGVIPGTNKPTLLKAGAEILRLWAGLAPEITIRDNGTNLSAGIFNYEAKCSLYRDGILVGEGVGSCNSLESKYRYRWVNERDLPSNIDKSTLISKEHISKAGGKWRTYRLENDNPQDLANTILKMAKKRAFVDAILTVTGASRIFTQDIEDMPEIIDVPPKSVPKEKPKTEPAEKPPALQDEPPGKIHVDVSSVGDLFNLCLQEFGKDSQAVLKILGAKTPMDIDIPLSEAYLKVLAASKEGE